MELKIAKFFNRWGNGYADALTKTISHIFLLAVLWASIALWALFFDHINGRELFVAMGTASILHFVVSEGIFKMLFPKFWRGRKRPYIAYPEEIRAIGREHRDSSFPSSHMSTTTAMLMVITYFYPFLWPASLFSTVLMAYARLHNGMHYLSDIVAGTVLGILYGLAGIYSAETILSFIF